ncbi:helix-turn-helix transcriptional regulator [Kitasatospora sp. YST-16]|uniref:PadR family transcriptional regulator n=1 Tax=unclassified Kitasatospora TaxID=2633591 RepID=UPI0004C2BE00|nr:MULTISPECIES: PadR family transcriptional regulator [unclassified Kitasatospora]WAL73805.1 helix-turn-helix transcriptional regulator [Kitasatospora sp. YST-16]WNW39878.1 helix-turn-helix transcriptional regulator [Streptomyces sp. Li-HN-5-13]
MTPVFGHGRLRLYLLKLLDESPRHGYEVIRLLEERFHGLYAPSAGTVYPRLAKLEAEGLVSHTTEGGRKVYRLTDAGRSELASRAAELTDLEVEIHDSVGQLAGAIRQDVRDNAKDLRAELWNQAAADPAASSAGTPWRDQESWQRAKEEFARLKAETKEQARRAKEQEKAARQQTKAAEAEARKLREQSKAARTAAQQEALRLKRRVEEQVRAHAAGGDWSAGLAEGLAELTRGLGSLADAARWGAPEEPAVRIDLDKDAPAPEAADLPDWARTDPDGDPARELERLLDRFRDHVRDTARDRGVDAARLARAQQALAAAARALYGR